MNVTSVKVSSDDVQEMITLIQAFVETSCTLDTDRDGEPNGNWRCQHCWGDGWETEYRKTKNEAPGIDPCNMGVTHLEDCLIFLADARLKKLKSLASIFNQE